MTEFFDQNEEFEDENIDDEEFGELDAEIETGVWSF